MGDQRGSQTANRKFPMQSGIAGRVYRTRNAFHARRVSDRYDAYIREHVTGFRESGKSKASCTPMRVVGTAVARFVAERYPG